MNATEELAPDPIGSWSTEADILDSAVGARADGNRAELVLLQACGAWAIAHPVLPGDDWSQDPCLAGEGCPDMDRRVIPELACRLHLTTEAASGWIGEALELRYRLPAVWELTRREQLPVWHARLIARSTIGLSREAARFVDRALAAVGGKVGVGQLRRTIAWAKTEFMPEVAEREAREVADRRDVQVDFDRDGEFHALAQLSGWVDHADALDLERALQSGAAALKAEGCELPLGARRSMALGDIARGQAALDLGGQPGDDQPGGQAGESGRSEEPAPDGQADAGGSGVRGSGVDGPGQSVPPLPVPARPLPRLTRELIVYVMIDGVSGAGIVAPGRVPICAENLRTWCGAPSTTKITVRPVIDLNEPHDTPAYRIPDRLREQVTLRDQRCVFPYCDRPAYPVPIRWTDDDEPVFGVDIDHIVPFDQGGPTSSGNTGPLCRHHHRMKTLTRWRYLMLRPGVFCWVDPSGHVYVRTRQGTVDLPVTPVGASPGDGSPGGSPPGGTG